jgi:aldose 1-epimerase
MKIQKEFFGKTPDDQAVELYTLAGDGLEARIITYGGTIISLKTPDRNGRLADIVLGCDTLDDYLKGTPHFGCVVGRYANRIRNARFSLDGTEYTLAKNSGENHIHGGFKGFDKVVWNAQEVRGKDCVAVKLTYLSKDGEEGYPGNLKCAAVYTLTNNNELKISYEAQTDKATILNLTNHSYFNLAGYDSGDILSHILVITADSFTVSDQDQLPTGLITAVKGTALDFTRPTAIGARIAQVKGGYDLNYVLNNTDGSLTLAARVCEPVSGRSMEVYTTQPGIQLYTGNFLDGSVKGKGTVYNKHYGLCLETQHYPDSPNHADFPSTVLRPGQKYQQLTVYKFQTQSLKG